MPVSNDIRTFVRGAEQAEARGDHVAAERLLRRALALQESSLGTQHPEVANTLNNLAIVCEMNGNLTDAEACYRRAYAIAVASFPPNDPFVVTSRDNLEQFCAARAIPFKRQPQPVVFGPRPSPAPAPKPAPPPRTAAAPPPAQASAAQSASPPLPSAVDVFRHEPVPPAAPSAVAVSVPRGLSRRPSLGVAAAALIAVAAFGWLVLSAPVDEVLSMADSPDAAETDAAPPEPSAAAPEPAGDAAPPPAVITESAEPTEATAPAESTAPAETSAPADTREATEPPAPASTAPRAASAPPPAPRAAERPVAAAPEPPATTAPGSPITVVTSELCRTLTTGSVWQCAPASGILAPGPVVFYTRVASPRDTIIEHRWYRGDELYQRVPLRIRANPAGYRTYSRTGITAERSGAWKVELRTQDGVLLDEKAFAVQP